MRRAASAVLAVLAVLTTVLLGACGGSAGGGSAPSGAATPGAAAEAPARSYVALGDSYAAAPGVPTTSLAGGCIRSDHNYPHLLAAAHHLALTDVTCSAASTWNLTAQQKIVEVSVPPQLDALRPSTRLVTLGIGGNDLDLFSTVLDRCLRGTPRCLASTDVGQDMRVVHRRLVKALRQIHHRSPRARVALVGYPQLIGADHAGCAGLPADRATLGTVRGLIADFSTMMGRAARKGGATYVDLIGPSAGHDICSSSPWINGDRITDEAWAFHPLPAEQQAVAKLVAQAMSLGSG